MGIDRYWIESVLAILRDAAISAAAAASRGDESIITLQSYK